VSVLLGFLEGAGLRRRVGGVQLERPQAEPLAVPGTNERTPTSGGGSSGGEDASGLTPGSVMSTFTRASVLASPISKSSLALVVAALSTSGGLMVAISALARSADRNCQCHQERPLPSPHRDVAGV
jgi:hypothetical protein